jgi:hypothetical protein
MNNNIQHLCNTIRDAMHLQPNVRLWQILVNEIGDKLFNIENEEIVKILHFYIAKVRYYENVRDRDKDREWSFTYERKADIIRCFPWRAKKIIATYDLVNKSPWYMTISTKDKWRFDITIYNWTPAACRLLEDLEERTCNHCVECWELWEAVGYFTARCQVCIDSYHNNRKNMSH